MRATMKPQEIADRFVEKFGNRVSDIRVKEWYEGVKKLPQKTVWMTIPRDTLNDAVAELIAIDYPHLGVIAAADNGEMIDLLYHLQVFFGGKHEEICVVLTVQVPKSDPHVPTISGLIPGAVYSEREKQDMIGIIVDGIPDARRIFLPEDFPEDVYPWRKDEKGIPPSMVKELWKVGRPTDRPAPPVAEPEPVPKSDTEEPPSGGAAE
ncbi:NADH-quinone oxidoreductase subunit C [Methanospirillum stamsii]|uniref:NADH-quinone oxidoreductase subunit F n=1 Tax=Methanospirillum stamsii TaxID=1277351 RepID=A0A2V2N9X3_9EURY|nr:NADH-quinone oxidoreductase subunit C [Methanospirillum stamsii]PWR75385.1 NADH-quinone oxidoreductase subunit F [Methanospirillum stamsii]